MKRLSLFAVLSAAILLVACHEIDNTGLEAESAPVGQMADATRSVNVSQSEAIEIADIFLRTDAGNNMLPTKSSGAQSKRISTTATVREDGQDLMYVFNYEGGGFVIVGSTRNYYPILAYSDKGSFIVQDDMGPVDVWLDETKVSIKNSSSQSAETRAQMQQLWARYDGTITIPSQEDLKSRRPQTRSTGEDSCWARIEYLQSQYGSEGWTFTTLRDAEQIFTDLGLSSYYANICYSAEQNHSALNETVIGYQNPSINQFGPFLETQWHQGFPFNKLCPNNIDVGCTVVAAAQVVKYHKFPANLSWDGVSFTLSDTDVPIAPDEYSKQPHLMRLLGQKLGIDYESGDNGASPLDVKNGLDSLGYRDTCLQHNNQTVHNELANYSRPVIMYGVDDLNNTNEADDLIHMWVCDGTKDYYYNQIKYFTENQPYGAGTLTQGMYTYNNPGIIGNIYPSYTYFYMNWGWGGYFDGWFGSNNVNSGYGDYKYERYNVYVKKQ